LPEVNFSQKLMTLVAALAASLWPAPRVLLRRRRAYAHIVAILVAIIIILVILLILTL
jgi:hypothetical protein